jgi:hypothetical protein
VRRARARLCLGVGLGCILSCSLLVDEEIQAVQCTEVGRIGPPACDPGEICAAERCRACVRDETCADGVDNDCDGSIDEGCGQDAGGRGGEGSVSAGTSGATEGGEHW